MANDKGGLGPWALFFFLFRRNLEKHVFLNVPDPGSGTFLPQDPG